MDDQLKYLFDLNGYIVLKNILPRPDVLAINSVLEHLENLAPERYPDNIIQSKPRTYEELYLSNIIEADDIFRGLIDLKPVIDIIQFTSLGLFRLNHSYSISHWKDAITSLHMGGTPIHPKAIYHVSNGEIFSNLTKAVFPIANHTVNDGCFAVVPGSHKSSFPTTFSADPEKHPSLIGVDAEPGDAIVFTEALTHGSLRNVSGRCRRSVFLCYSVGYMPDWTKLNLRFSETFIQSLDDSKREIVRLKIT